MVPQTELIFKDYQSLVPGILSICLETVWVPFLSAVILRGNASSQSETALCNQSWDHWGNGLTYLGPSAPNRRKFDVV